MVDAVLLALKLLSVCVILCETLTLKLHERGKESRGERKLHFTKISESAMCIQKDEWNRIILIISDTSTHSNLF